MNYIVDDIGTVVSAMRADWSEAGEEPYYMYDHRLNISKRLLAKGLNAEEKFKKYPLIALRMDIPETKSNGIISYRLNIGIFAFTDKNYSMEERYTNVFKTTLYPLYELFIEKLRESGLFMWPGYQEYPEHTKIDRPFWGTSGAEKNEKYIFTDPLDAIELLDLRVNSRIKTC